MATASSDLEDYKRYLFLCSILFLRGRGQLIGRWVPAHGEKGGPRGADRGRWGADRAEGADISFMSCVYYIYIYIYIVYFIYFAYILFYFAT